jgi:hypothetical protein
MVPDMTCGTGGTGIYYNTNAATNTTGVVTGGYRKQTWNAATYPWNTDTATTAYTVADMQAIQFRTLDIPYAQYTPGPTYTVRYYNGGGDTTGNWIYETTSVCPPKTAAERLKEILNSRMAPSVLSNCRPLGYTEDVREVRARETLRRVLGENRFRDFVRRGSVSIRAKTGLVYQIFPGSDFTKVYDNGKLIERLCVVLLGGFPPTDSLIMRYLMILNNEQQFRGYAIKHAIQMPYLLAAPDQRSLIEIFKELKKVA